MTLQDLIGMFVGAQWRGVVKAPDYFSLLGLGSQAGQFDRLQAGISPRFWVRILISFEGWLW